MAGQRSEFVGRTDLLERFDRAREERRAIEVVGASGSGKTALVRQFDARTESIASIQIDLEGYDPGHPGVTGPSASVGAVQANFRRFTDLLTHLVAAGRSTAEAEEFDRVINEAYQAEVAGRRIFSLELAMRDVRKTLGPGELADAWRASKEVVAADFLARWNRFEDDSQQRLLVLDNADIIADQEIGHWLAELLPHLERTVVVVTRRSSSAQMLLGHFSGPVEELAVEEFDRADLHRFLNRDARFSVHEAVSAQIHGITGGHPGTIVIMHDLLWKPGLHETLDVSALLEEANQEQTNKLPLLVERLVCAQVAPPNRFDGTADYGQFLWTAVKAAAVPRQFDIELLGALLATEDGATPHLPDLFRALRELPFVEVLDRPGVPPNSRYRIHRYVRDGLLDQMIQLEPHRYTALHTRAAEFHRTALMGSDSASLDYGESFIYELPEWQTHKREWLHHRSHETDEQARRDAVLECARVFLEAFWWWGNYVHFDFTDQLVSDLGHMVRSQRHLDTSEAGSWGDLESLHAALSDLLESYPPRSTKPDADWDRVRNALLEIEDACGLDRSSGPLRPEDHKIEALLHIFLAHTYRYEDPDDPTADDHYADAEHHLRLVLERSGDDGDEDADWNLAWVNYERADLLDEASDIDEEEIRRWWQAAADMVQEPPPAEPRARARSSGTTDEELASNLHRLRGDRCARAGDHQRAAQWYRRAVLHAYLFHLAGDQPDEYTLQFYVDIRARAINRILTLLADGREQEALEFAVELAAVKFQDTVRARRRRRADGVADDPGDPWRGELAADLGPRLAAIDPVELADLLFLRGPGVEDLGTKRSTPFRIEYRKRRDALDETTAGHDLHDPRWP